MRIAYRPFSRDLRGTALEYLENVLPEDVRLAFWPPGPDDGPPGE